MHINDLVHNGGVGEGGDVPQLVGLVGCNLAEDATHDLTGARLW